MPIRQCEIPCYESVFVLYLQCTNLLGNARIINAVDGNMMPISIWFWPWRDTRQCVSAKKSLMYSQSGVESAKLNLFWIPAEQCWQIDIIRRKQLKYTTKEKATNILYTKWYDERWQGRWREKRDFGYQTYTITFTRIDKRQHENVVKTNLSHITQMVIQLISSIIFAFRR